ncbi:hypothetical protein [Salinarimonas soli]|uniref:Uncharacterized protein n=1 Tax=Salinarimonas soli TaxID=1638099 RepID=A0A5B2VAB6_9HYPH|nr:hypothetical protein [Salinarimonas soli]KAA2235746.1 hypothetical protein F0L46_18140 [Salinarimonas soli]
MRSRIYALLRSETLFIALSAGSAALAAVSAFAWLGFFGILLLGLLTLVISLRVGIEEDGPSGSGHTPGLYAMSLRDPATAEERLARSGESAAFRRLLRFVNGVGAALVVIGGAGFWWLQLG